MMERRTTSGDLTRGRTEPAWNVAFRVLRWIAGHARNAYATFGLFLLLGAIIAVAFTAAFVQIAGHVSSGSTQAFDDMVMTWIGENQSPLVRSAMIEITMLGTGTVVMTSVLIAGAFLWLNQHKHSAILLGVATLGGLVLNNLLKAGFDRPRPQIFEWGTHAVTSSFPSGHAMSSAIVYGTVAYLAARLQKNRTSRIATMALAGILIVLISASRLYLGVHYPSDVLAGVAIGLAWAAFCMATLEAAQLYARRNEPAMLDSEKPAPPEARETSDAAVAVAAGVEAGMDDAKDAEGSSAGDRGIAR
jgi:undecaprenyl-diphosphatase